MLGQSAVAVPNVRASLSLAGFSQARARRFGGSSRRGNRGRRSNGHQMDNFNVDVLKMHRDMLSRAARFYWSALASDSRALSYLQSRGLSAATIHRFGLGYAPKGTQALRDVFVNYQVPALLDCGLVAESGNQRYDRFRDRIMFPILNDDGRVIAFGGRVIDEGAPKYLNSPETPLFDKSSTLFGLPQALSSIRESGEVVVVEGYLDVAMLAQAGISNVVGTLGTATTVAHARKLALMARRVVFCFDGDAAGYNAAMRALDAFTEFVGAATEVAFVFLPVGHDPDSFVQAEGEGAFRALLANAIPFDRFLMSLLTAEKDLTTCEGRAALAVESLPVVSRLGLSRIDPPTWKQTFIVELAELANMTPDELLALA